MRTIQRRWDWDIYAEQVRSLQPFQYMELQDNDAIARDSSPNNYHGTHTGAALHQPGLGDNNTCPYYDGVNDFTDIYSAAQGAAFPTTNISISMWLYPELGVWGDGVTRRALQIRNNAYSARIIVQKEAVAARLTLYYITAAGNHIIDYNATPTQWFNLILQMSDSGGSGSFYAYANNVEINHIIAGIGAFTGPIVESVIGAGSVVPAQVWRGWIAHVAIFGRLLTTNERNILARLS